MYSDQEQYSIDYLNQIAPSSQKNGGGRKWLVIGLILGVLTLVVVALMAFSSMSSGPSKDLSTLSARLTSLGKIAKAAQPNIKSGDLRSTNSNLSIFLTNTIQDSTQPLITNGVDPKKISKEALAAESYPEMTKTLEDARFNAVYDSVYVREMNLRLAELNTLMTRIYTTTGSKSMKEFLLEADKTLPALRAQFNEIGKSSTLQ